MPNRLGKLDTLYMPVYLQLLHVGAYANSWLVLWFVQHFLLKLCITLCFSGDGVGLLLFYQMSCLLLLSSRVGYVHALLCWRNRWLWRMLQVNFIAQSWTTTKKVVEKAVGDMAKFEQLNFLHVSLPFNRIIPGHAHQMLSVVCEEQVSSLLAGILL